MKRREFLKTTAVLGLSTVARFSPAEEPASRPNILFCIADDASFPHMGAYGCPWVSTPAFDRVARDGILFTRAYTPNAKCAPSRACILTGRNSWQLEEAANHWCHFPAEFKTYPEVLSENGYHVGYTAKGWAPGIPGKIEGKDRQLTGRQYSRHKLDAPTKNISKIDYAANFREFLDDKPADQPFCFWYGCSEPHRAYEYASGISKGGKKLSDIDRVFPFWQDNEIVRTDLLDYAYELEYFDQHLQKMLDLLEERGELDNTIIVVTADNGMPFPRIKGQEYEYSNHLPLAIMWKNGIKNPGRVVNDFVSFIDFAPTFLQIADISQEESGMQPITGTSLFDIFTSEAAGQVNPQRDHVLLGKERHDVGRPHDWGYPIRGIVKDDFLYIRNFEPARWPAGNPETGYPNTDGSPTKTVCIEARHDPETLRYWELNLGRRPEEELYNIRIDPDCMNNLAQNAVYEELKNQLQEQMTQELKEQDDPRMFGKGHIFDEYPYADENWRNFYEKRQQGDPRTPGWVSKTDMDEKLD